LGHDAKLRRIDSFVQLCSQGEHFAGRRCRGAYVTEQSNASEWWTIWSVSTVRKGPLMHLTLSLTPLVSLLAGILILIVPRLLNYIVAVYLIVIGILGLIGDIHLR
jgi:hypothetical protein